MISQDKSLSIKTQDARQLSTWSRLHFDFVSGQHQIFFFKRYKKTSKWAWTHKLKLTPNSEQLGTDIKSEECSFQKCFASACYFKFDTPITRTNT